MFMNTIECRNTSCCNREGPRREQRRPQLIMMIPVMMTAMDMISVGMITNLPIHLLCTKGEDLAVVVLLLLEDINIRVDGALYTEV